MNRVVIEGVNLNETEAWTGEDRALPSGEYQFEVMEVAVLPAKQPGKSPQLEFQMVVLGGADSDQYNGVKRRHWLSLSPKAAGRVRNMCDACGVPLDAAGGFDADAFPGKSFLAEVYTDSYDKPNLGTGQVEQIETSKIRKERPVSAGWSTDAAAPAAAVAPAAAAVPAPAAPAAVPAPAAPATRAPQPPKPRAPIPPRR